MVSRGQIEKSIDDLLTKKGLMVVKCKPSYRPSVLNAFSKYASKYGFTMKTYKDKDIYNKNALVTLYDPNHNTAIEFSKDFINQNLIDFTNTNKKHIDIEDIFIAYDNLPDKCKDATGLIKHTVEEKQDDIVAWSKRFDDEELEFCTITMPAYFLEKLNNGDEDNHSYDFILAHESMHSRDYRPLTESEKRVYVKERVNGKDSLLPNEIGIYEQAQDKMSHRRDFLLSGAIDWDNGGEVIDDKNFSVYLDGYFKNRDYLNGDLDGYPNNLNKASDYGRTRPSEDFAEFGAMVITGYKNPTNPNSRVYFNGEWMQYQEWARLHPYTVQYIVKDLYGEEPSIDDILEDTVPTRYGEFGVKIEDFK